MDLAITPDSKRVLILGFFSSKEDNDYTAPIKASLDSPSAVLETIEHVHRVAIYDFALKIPEMSVFTYCNSTQNACLR